MDREGARAQLVELLHLAYSGELAATYAYRGHAGSVRDPQEKSDIRRIMQEEIDHRECVGEMMATLGEKPRPARELKMSIIGRTIGFLCYIGGWFVPMYGAARLESKNIKEYEDAARHALEAGHEEMVDQLLLMAEVEWDHERYFREKCEGHWLWRYFPHWKLPPPRADIRGSFAEFRTLALAS